jgi:hypothetical protein
MTTIGVGITGVGAWVAGIMAGAGMAAGTMAGVGIMAGAGMAAGASVDGIIGVGTTGIIVLSMETTGTMDTMAIAMFTVTVEEDLNTLIDMVM